MNPANAARALLARALLVLFLAASAALPDPQGTVTGADGVVRVRNPAQPALPDLALELEELWRIGGDSEAAGEFFGVIVDIAVDPSGDVYLLDRQLAEVKVFTRDGEFLRTIGREGGGPGEFRQPGALFFMPDGNVAVVQARPSGLVLLTKQGEPADEFPIPGPEEGGFRVLQRGLFRGGSLVLHGNNFSFHAGRIERSHRLVRMDMQGRQVATFHEATSRMDMANVVIRERDGSGYPWTVAPNGAVLASLDFGYTIHVWGPDGRLQRIIEREYEPLMRSPREMDRLKQRLGSRPRRHGRRGSPKVEVSDRDRDIRWMEVTDSGHVWVLSSRGAKRAPEGALGTFDVFDAQGRFQQRVTLAGEGDFEEDRFILVADRLFVVTQFAAAVRAMMGSAPEDDEDVDDAEPMAVICYRFDWTPPRAVAAPSQ
ncbi:MAG: 6-bladed beta-propeller [Candidatus Krumholzibacteriia bacterium]